MGVPVARPRNNTFLLALLLVGAGCIYTFDNPVRLQQNGSIAGKVALTNAVQGQTTVDGGVSVPWSGGLGLQLDVDGGFSFLQLPDGTYALNIYIPPLASNDFPLLNVLNGIVLPVSQNQVDALNLGVIQVQPSGRVSGTVTNGQGVGISAVVAAYATPDAGSGVGTFEGFSTTSAPDGSYSILLPAGNHILAASDPFSAVTASVNLPASQILPQDLLLDAGSASTVALVEGNLVFGGPGFGASAQPSLVNPILPGIQYQAFNQNRVMVVAGTVFPSSAMHVPGLGAPFVLSLPPGQALDVEFLFPTNIAVQLDGGVFDPLWLRGLPAVLSIGTYLGQVTWLPTTTFSANGFDAGHADSYDGGSGGSGSATTGTGGTTGSTTGGTGGTITGGTGGLGQWTLVNSLTLPNVDGGPPSIFGVLPLPLADGGNRIIWADSTNVYYADDPGPFGSPIPLIDAGDQFPLRNLSAAKTDGGSVVAWTSISGGVEAAFIPDQGGVPNSIVVSPLTPVFPAFQGTTTFAGSLGGVAGTFILAPALNGGIAVLFTSDNQTSRHLTIPIGFGGTIFAETIAGAACNISDFTSGFCFVGSGAVGSYTNFDAGVVFVGSADTSGGSLLLVNIQKVIDLPPLVTSSVVSLSAIPNDAGPDTVYITGVVGIPTQTAWASFGALNMPPAVQVLPGGQSLVELLLPWAGQALGLSLTLFQLPNGVSPLFVPSGAPAASFLPDVLGGYPAGNFGILNGYTDPLTGRPTIAVAADDGGALSIWQLPATPAGPVDGGIVSDSGTGTDSGGGWTLVASHAPFGDGGTIVETTPLAVPASGGGHRLVWTEAGGPNSFYTYVADETNGTFTTPQLVTSTGTTPGLLAATDLAGNSLLAWQQGGTKSMYLPLSGATSTPATPDFLLLNPQSVVSIKLGSTPGFAVVGGSDSPGLIRMAFTSDGGGFSGFNLGLPDAGAVYPASMVATPCAVDDLDGGDGFCVAGTFSFGIGQQAVFAAAISSSGTTPTVVGYQVLYTSDAGIPVPALTTNGAGSNSATVAWFDPAVPPLSLYYAQFNSLATTPSEALVTQTGNTGDPPTLFWWRNGPLAVFDLFLPLAVVRSVVLPPATAMAPPDRINDQFGPMAGFVDPLSGTIVVTPDHLLTNSLRIYELAP
jgi:hypothetical protein